MIIDSHAHIYSYDNIDKIVEDAKRSGVETIISISTDLESSNKNIVISEKYKEVFCSVGIHPCDCVNHKISDLDKIEQLSFNSNNKAIGEIGLDFFYTKDDKKIQYEFLDYQIDIANKRNLPFVVHARDSYNELIDFLKTKDLKTECVIHCFTGDKLLAKQFLDFGCYISFTGIVTFKKSTELRDVAAFIPNDKIMVETDSPYLSPHPNRGKTNYPSNLIYIAECISEAKKFDFQTFCKNLKENTVKFYRL